MAQGRYRRGSQPNPFAWQQWAGFFLRRSGWLVGVALLAVIGLLAWEWRLGLALLVGSGVMLLIFFSQSPAWIQRWRGILSFLRGGQAPLVWAVAGGGAATLGTYTVASIWAESNQHWLATGAILQGMATLTILTLLLWEWIQRRSERSRSRFEQLLAEIASPDPFKRLVGVRRLQQSVAPEQGDPHQMELAVDYLRLALEKESIPVVREAMLEALRSWGILRRLDEQGNPLAPPI